MGNFQENCLFQFPSKKWGFRGTIDIRLAVVINGKPLETQEEIDYALSNYGGVIDPCRRITTRVWDAREDAEKTARDYGLIITPPCNHDR